MENKEKKWEARTAPAPEATMPEVNTTAAPVSEAATQESNTAPAPAPDPAPAPAPAAQTAEAGKGSFWKEKVTRKFLAIALAVALALNIVLTAGVAKLIGPGRGFDKGRSGRPGNEQQFNNGRGGRGHMMPPSGGSQPGAQQNQQPGAQQNQQPGAQQNPQPDAQQDQQSDDQQNGDQKSNEQNSSD